MCLKHAFSSKKYQSDLLFLMKGVSEHSQFNSPSIRAHAANALQSCKLFGHVGLYSSEQSFLYNTNTHSII